MRLVVVSEDFFPSSLVGAQRVTGFVKNLPSHGVSTVVLAGSKRKEAEDVPLSTLFPSLATSSEDATTEAVSESRVIRLSSAVDVPRLSSRLHGALEGDGRAWITVIARKLTTLYSVWTFGEHRAWVRRAIGAGCKAGQTQRFDAIFATLGDEYWNFGVAHALGEELGVPVVLDFRDDWDRFSPYRGRLAPRYPLMRRFVRSCALATCATQSVADRLLEYWPRTPTVVIRNGFEIHQELLPCPQESAARDEIRLAHVGTFWKNAQWWKLCDALADLARSAPVSVVFRGRNPEQFKAAVLDRDYPANVRFDLGGLVSPSRVYELYQDVDVLLASAPDDYEGSIPAKINEAIGFSKPFVLLADTQPEGLKTYLKDCPSPYLLVDSEVSSEGIAQFVGTSRGSPAADGDQRLLYSSRARTAELFRALKATLPSSARR